MSTPALPRSGPGTSTAGPSSRSASRPPSRLPITANPPPASAADLRPVRPRGHPARPAPLPGAPRHRHPGAAPLRPPPRRAGVAAAQPTDALEPAPPADLGRRPPVRAPADRPATQTPRASEHRQADPPAGGVPGADPRSPTGRHHVGTMLCQPGAARGQPRAARPAGRPAAGAVAALRTAQVRAVRPADAGAVFGQRPS